MALLLDSRLENAMPIGEMQTLLDLYRSHYHRISFRVSFNYFCLTARDPIPDKEAMRDEARVKSSNALGHWDTKASGGDDNDESQRRLARAGLDVQTSEDKAVMIIIAASIFGTLVLIANLLIIVFLAQRHRKKMHQQRRSSGKCVLFPL